MSRTNREEDQVLDPCFEEEMGIKASKKRRANPKTELQVIDLVDDTSPRAAPRRLKATRAQPESLSKQLGQPPSPIYIDDDEPGPSSYRPSRSRSQRSNRSRRLSAEGPSSAPFAAPAPTYTWGEKREERENPEDALLARRLQQQEELRVAREQRALAYRLDELERQEEAASARSAATAAQNRRGARATRAPPQRRNFSAIDGGPQQERDRRRRRYDPSEDFEMDEDMPSFGFARSFSTTGPRSIRRGRWPPRPDHLAFAAMADAFGQALGEDGGEEGRSGGNRGPGARFNSILTELAALHQAVSGARAGALPTELLFSDRDFTEDDYEALLALDDSIENRKGAAQDVINQLPAERVPRGGGHDHTFGDCVICMDNISTGQLVRKLECKHCFHSKCIDKWLRQKAVCPVCQRSIV